MDPCPEPEPEHLDFVEVLDDLRQKLDWWTTVTRLLREAEENGRLEVVLSPRLRLEIQERILDTKELTAEPPSTLLGEVIYDFAMAIHYRIELCNLLVSRIHEKP